MDFQHPLDDPGHHVDAAQLAAQLVQAIGAALSHDPRDAALWLPGPAAERLALGAKGASHPFDLCMAAAMQNRDDALCILLDMGYAPQLSPAPAELDWMHCDPTWAGLLVECAAMGLCGPIERIAKLASVDAPGADGSIPLLCAAANGHEEAALLLLRLGADPHARAPRGQTPLMAAAMGNCCRVLIPLLLTGADPHAEDNFGRNAIGYARSHKSHAFLASLEAFEIEAATGSAAAAPRARASL